MRVLRIYLFFLGLFSFGFGFAFTTNSASSGANSATSGDSASFSGVGGGLGIGLLLEGLWLDSLVSDAQVFFQVGDTLLVDHVVVVAPVVDFGGQSLGGQRLHDLVDLHVLDLELLVLGSKVLR